MRAIPEEGLMSAHLRFLGNSIAVSNGEWPQSFR